MSDQKLTGKFPTGERLPTLRENPVPEALAEAGKGNDCPHPNTPRQRAPAGPLSGHVYASKELVWDSRILRLGSKRGRALATVEPDTERPGMFRVLMPDGRLSDMVNLTRAKDAALSLALAVLNRRKEEPR